MMEYFIGIDIGSSSIKTVLIDQNASIVNFSVVPTGYSFNKNSENALLQLLSERDLKISDIKSIVSTGYGRKLFKLAQKNISEITANAKGAYIISKLKIKLKTIINIGGQDSKIIIIDDSGKVQNFFMNDKCAAGTGRFLEMVSRNLEIDIENFGNIHFQHHGTPLSINNTCAVFAESEIISLLAEGHNKSGIISGVHHSIAKRISIMANRIGIEDSVLFDGGTALNKGMVAALEDELLKKIYVPEHPQITTALGAAIIAKENDESN